MMYPCRHKLSFSKNVVLLLNRSHLSSRWYIDALDYINATFAAWTRGSATRHAAVATVGHQRLCSSDLLVEPVRSRHDASTWASVVAPSREDSFILAAGRAWHCGVSPPYWDREFHHDHGRYRMSAATGLVVDERTHRPSLLYASILGNVLPPISVKRLRVWRHWKLAFFTRCYGRQYNYLDYI